VIQLVGVKILEQENTSVIIVEFVDMVGLLKLSPPLTRIRKGMKKKLHKGVHKIGKHGAICAEVRKGNKIVRKCLECGKIVK